MHLYVYMGVCMCIWAFVCVYALVCMYVCVYVCMYGAFVCVYVRLYASACMHVCVSVVLCSTIVSITVGEQYFCSLMSNYSLVSKKLLAQLLFIL